MPGLMDFILGSPDKLKKIPTGTPQMEGLQNQVIGQYGNQIGQQNDILAQLKQMMEQGGGYNNAQNYYNNLLDQGGDAYEKFAEPYLQQFQEQMLPNIAERFAGGGALSSSGFGQVLGGASAGLQSQLAQLFSQLQQNAAGAQTNQYNQLGNQALQAGQLANQGAQIGLGYQPYAYQQKQGSGGILGPLATGLGSALGGPLGGALAGGISSLFKKPASGQGGLAGNNASLASLMQLMGG